MLGKRLNELRLAKAMSLRDLARETGLSATLLSQIERGVTEPSLTTLRKLSAVFGQSVSSLFAAEVDDAIWISRPGQRTSIMGPQGGVSYERVSRGNGQMEVLRAVFQPGQFSTELPITHPSMECVYVIRGSLTAQIGGQDRLVNAGECLSFDANTPHRYVNTGSDDAEIIMSVTPPVP